MGFDVTQRSAIIYDSGSEPFSGTTLAGVGQAVAGVTQNPSETANRFVKVLSIQTCQTELLQAFEDATNHKRHVRQSTTKALVESGRAKLQASDRGRIFDMLVSQLYDLGEARCVVAPSWKDSDGGSWVWLRRLHARS